MKKTQIKKKFNIVKKRLSIYISISCLTLLLIIPLTCIVYSELNCNSNLDWIIIIVEVLLAFFTGSVFAIVVDIIPYYSEKRLCKKSLAALIKTCFYELESIENLDAKQLVLDKYYDVFRDFFLVQSGIMGDTAFECLKKMDEIKVKKLTSIKPDFSLGYLQSLKDTFNNWLILF